PTRNAVIVAEAEHECAKPIPPFVLAVLSAELAEDVDEAQAQEWRREVCLRRASHACEQCGHVFLNGDVIVRWRETSRDPFLGISWRLASYCIDCAELPGEEAAKPCDGGCGALVAIAGERTYYRSKRFILASYFGDDARRTYCSERCVALARRVRH